VLRLAYLQFRVFTSDTRVRVVHERVVRVSVSLGFVHDS